jgi:superfamily II DNA/RNA helicase
VLGRVQALVLDEADEMLDLGFLPDVERIMRMLPEKRHTMLFSATMPGPIIALSRAFLNRPTHIRAEEADQGSIHERTRQLVYRAHAMDKVELLTRVLQAADRGLTMIFARTKRTVQRVADDLADRGFAAAAVHGDLGQGAREQALRAFRSGKVDVLVATDVAARGIDVTDVTHVINYQCPEDAKTYVHRIGRTGRVGRTGRAITFVTPDQKDEIARIERDVNTTIGEWETPEERLEHAPRPRRRERGARRERGERSREERRPEAAEANGNGSDGKAETTKLFVNRGENSGIGEDDLRWALREGAVLPDEAVHDVRVLHRFSFVEVDPEQAERTVEYLDGTKLKGKEIRLEIAKS